VLLIFVLSLSVFAFIFVFHRPHSSRDGDDVIPHVATFFRLVDDLLDEALHLSLSNTRNFQDRRPRTSHRGADAHPHASTYQIPLVNSARKVDLDTQGTGLPDLAREVCLSRRAARNSVPATRLSPHGSAPRPNTRYNNSAHNVHHVLVVLYHILFLPTRFVIRVILQNHLRNLASNLALALAKSLTLAWALTPIELCWKFESISDAGRCTTQQRAIR
jgi:hypothetical protein